MEFREMQRMVYETAKANGWHDTTEVVSESSPVMIAVRLALIHSEVSEALEAVRQPNPVQQRTGLREELADIVIRVMDLAEALGIDLEGAIIEKDQKNRKRGYRHGGKRI